MLDYPQRPGFKTRNPETSVGAANRIKPRSATLRESVLNCLKCTDLTADEVATALGESALSIRPRLSELVKMGKIEDAGIRRSNVSGVKATVWKMRKTETKFVQQWIL